MGWQIYADLRAVSPTLRDMDLFSHCVFTSVQRCLIYTAGLEVEYFMVRFDFSFITQD